MGNVGGINSLILITCLSIYYFYHYQEQKLVMVHAIYGLKKQKQSWCRSKKKTVSLNSNKAKPQTLMSNEPDTAHNIRQEKGTIFAPPELIDEAWSNVQQSLDLVTLCREINVIKYLSSILFKDYQRALIPLACLNQQIQNIKMNEQKNNYTKRKSLLGKWIGYGELSPLGLIGDDYQNLQSGVNKLFKNVNESGTRRSEQIGHDKRGSEMLFDDDPNPVLKRLESEMNDNLFKAINDCAIALKIPIVIPSLSVQNPDTLEKTNFKIALTPSPFSIIAKKKKLPRYQKPELESSNKKF